MLYLYNENSKVYHHSELAYAGMKDLYCRSALCGVYTRDIWADKRPHNKKLCKRCRNTRDPKK